MENPSQKIWKYMDLAKFISLLSKQALYFACPYEFYDPWEGYVPKSYAQEFADEHIKRIDEFEALREGINHLIRNKQLDDNEFKLVDPNLKKLDDEINKIDASLVEEINEKISLSGVSCWHKSDHESEAMWKLYSASGQGIAIESTVGQLRDSIKDQAILDIKSVTYLSDDAPKNEENGKRGFLFWKRKSFEHEQELRAVIALKEKGKGTFVDCDIDKLISRIHVSPIAPYFFNEIVEKICVGNVRGINKPVIRSILFDKPDYTVKGLARR